MRHLEVVWTKNRSGFTLIEVLLVIVIFSLLWGSYHFSLNPGSHTSVGVKQLLWAQNLVDQAILTAHQQPTQTKSESVHQTYDSDLPSSYLLSASTRSASILFHSEHLMSVQMPYLEQVPNKGNKETYNIRIFSRLIKPSTALAEKYFLYRELSQ